MNVPCFKVIRLGRRWGVTELSLDWVLAEFDERDSATDYARSLATASEEAILEGENEFGHLEVRHVFSTDSSGIMRMNTVVIESDLSAA